MRKLLATIFQLTSQVEAELSAAKVDDLASKYPELESDIRALNEQDPSKSKKYLTWGVKQLTLGAPLQDLVLAIRDFHSRAAGLENKDINSYDSLSKMKDALSSTAPSKKSFARQAKSSAQTLLETDRWLLIHPKNMEAATAYGSNTKWCVASKRPEKNYFNNYSSSNSFFYFLIDKQAPSGVPMGKLAIVISKDNKGFLALWDAKNTMLPRGQVQAYYDENLTDGLTFDEIMAICREHCDSQPDTWQYTMLNSTDEETVEAIFFQHRPVQELLQSSLARRSSTPATVLAELANSPSDYVRGLVAQNPNFSS